ncbi:hypothetical protein [Paraglaciecola sp.]|uniref:hypothetical protein n=1 Tax=Paraglaciecola sp. TaxID=1920173 RepID=UPI0030F3AED9
MYKLSALLALILLFVSCGESSGSGGSSGDSGGSVQNTLSIKLLYSNSCGQSTPASDAAVIIHNSDLSNEKIIMADANGEINYNTNDTKKTFSTVFLSNAGNSGIKPVNVTTYVDHLVMDVGEIEHHNNDISNCECQTSDLRVQLPVGSAGIVSVKMSGNRSFADLDNDDGFTNIKGIEHCKNPSGEWPITSVFIETSDGTSYGAIIPDISATSEVTADLLGDKISIFTNQGFVQARAKINGVSHFANYNTSSAEIVAFSSPIIDFTEIFSYDYEDIYGIEDVDTAYVYTFSSINTKTLNQTFDLLKPQIDYTELAGILDAPNNYNVQDQGIFDLVLFRMYAAYGDELLLFWTVEAPLSGSALNIENLDIETFISESTLDNLVDYVQIDLAVDGYEGINGYADFQNKKISKNASPLGFNSDWAYSEYGAFTIQMSTLNLTNAGKAMSANVLKNATFKTRVKVTSPAR